MRKTTTAFLAAVLLAFPFGAVMGQNLANSKHDFTTTGGVLPYDFAAGLCVTCHVPHATTSLSPLWGHITASAAGWTMYSSATLDATAATAPANVSLACLSCHDGTVAVDAYGATPAGSTSRVMPPASAAYLGKDLSQDHPISILYGQPAADFNTTAAAGWAGTAATDSLPLYGASQNQIECGSCHNPHDATTIPKFLRRSEAAICTVCHIK